MKIKNWSRLICNIYDKNNYEQHIRTLKQALNHGLILKQSAQSNSIQSKGMV